MKKLMPVLVLLLVAAVGVKIVLLPVLLERAKGKLIENVDRDEMLRSWGVDMMSGSEDRFLREALERPGPVRQQLAKLERKKSATLVLSDIELTVESPESIEEKYGGQMLVYPTLTFWIGPARRREDIPPLPASWGAGRYDRFLHALNANPDEVELVTNFAELNDLKARLVEKLASQRSKYRKPREEVLGDGFRGLLREVGRVELTFRPEHDPEPYWVIFVDWRHDERDMDKIMELFESMSVGPVEGE